MKNLNKILWGLCFCLLFVWVGRLVSIKDINHNKTIKKIYFWNIQIKVRNKIETIMTIAKYKVTWDFGV